MSFLCHFINIAIIAQKFTVDAYLYFSKKYSFFIPDEEGIKYNSWKSEHLILYIYGDLSKFFIFSSFSILKKKKKKELCKICNNAVALRAWMMDSPIDKYDSKIETYLLNIYSKKNLFEKHSNNFLKIQTHLLYSHSFSQHSKFYCTCRFIFCQEDARPLFLMKRESYLETSNIQF